MTLCVHVQEERIEEEKMSPLAGCILAGASLVCKFLDHEARLEVLLEGVRSKILKTNLV